MVMTMWKKPWSMKEGALLGAGMIVVGLMLELSAGPVVWELFMWPANLIMLAVMVLMLLFMHLYRQRCYAFQFLSTLPAVVPTLCYVVMLTIVMGLTRQTVGGAGLNNMLTFWPFVLIYFYLTMQLGLVILRRMTHLKWKRDLLFMLSHVGLFLAMTTATLSNPDMRRVKMITAVGEPEWRVINEAGEIQELPLAIELRKFIMEEYDDGTPRRFASDVNIFTKSGKNISATVDVNKPLSVEGWKIYQYGYDTAKGRDSSISILELVSDPWLPYVYAGIWMMVLGAVLMFVMGVRRTES